MGAPKAIPTDLSNPYTTNVNLFTMADGSIKTVWANEGNGNALMNRTFAEGTSGAATVTYNAGTDTYSITRPADSNGILTIGYEVSDGTNATSASKTITIAAVNDLPVAADASVSVNEGASLSGSVSATDAEGSSLSYQKVTNPSHGSVTFNSNGTFTYTPSANYYGTDSFTYRVHDGTAWGNTATVSITVHSVNDAPVASNGTKSTNEDTAATGTVTASDTEGSSLTYSVVTGPSHGSLTLNSNGSYSYTPDANYHGADSFTYKANDGTDDSNTATVSLTVNSVNDAPVRVSTPTLADGTEDQTFDLYFTTLFDGITDADGDGLVDGGISIDHGTYQVFADRYTITPDANYNGALIVSYSVSDGTVTTNTSLTYQIGAVQDLPQGTPSTTYGVNEDTAKTVTLAQLLNGMSEVDGETLSVTGLSADNGTFVDNGNGTFTYTPDANFNGNDTLHYSVTDGIDPVAVSSTITVISVNDPLVNNTPASIADGTEDTSFFIATSALTGGVSDADGDTIIVTAISAEHASVTTTTGGFIITPELTIMGQ